MSSSGTLYKSEEARINIACAKQLLRDMLGGLDTYTSDRSDELVDLIFTAAVLESNANIRYVVGRGK